MPAFIDLTGQRFGRLAVLKRASNHRKRVAWHCHCDCGRHTIVVSHQLIGGHTVSCGCAKRERFGLLRWRPKPQLGDRFGRLTVIKFLADDPKHPHVRCQCDCGKICAPTWYAVTHGVTQSCGCIRREITAELAKTHGLSHTREYWIWIHMIARCHDRKNKSFFRYGARGIIVCDRWRYDFLAFLADMGLRPSPNHSLDRFPDFNGNYEPGNCRWATPIEQARNHRRNHRVTWRGETRTVTEWSEVLDISETCLRQRLRQLHWSVERAFTTPSQRS